MITKINKSATFNIIKKNKNFNGRINSNIIKT